MTSSAVINEERVEPIDFKVGGQRSSSVTVTMDKNGNDLMNMVYPKIRIILIRLQPTRG